MADQTRRCAACGQVEDHNNDPRHVITGLPGREQLVTLADGTQTTAVVAADSYYHFDCHAALGCAHCVRMLDAHKGSVKGRAKKLTVPKGLDDTPFTLGANGVLVPVES